MAQAQWWDSLVASFQTESVHYYLLASLIWVLTLVTLRWLAVRLISRRSEDARFLYNLRKSTSWIAAALTLLGLGYIWFPRTGNLGTFVGLLSAGLAIALRDLITSLAGWIYIVWQRPFEVGDRIQIGDQAGDVVDQGIIRFSLMEIGQWVAADQSTGRVIHIPNSRVFSDNIANYTYGFPYIWNELVVTVTFESNWEKAKRILQDIADQHAGRISQEAAKSVRRAAHKAMIVYSRLTPRVWTKVGDFGVVLTTRYLCHPRRRRGTAELLWEACLHEFDRCPDIDFAYPTYRRYVNPEEGKPETGGPPDDRGS